MKISAYVSLLVVAVVLACGPDEMGAPGPPDNSAAADVAVGAPVLRHVVAIEFKPDLPDAQRTEVIARFGQLRDSIPGIVSYEHGANNSPEGLDKGINHVFTLGFESEAARAGYLPHPAHLRFVEILEPAIADVTVVDYWTAR